MDIPTMVCDKFGNEKTGILMTGVSHMKNGNFNLFSVTRAMMSGWKLTGDEESIRIQKGDLTISFDIVIKTTKGALYCAHMKRKRLHDKINGAEAEKKKTVMSVANAHALLGHCNEDATRKTAKHLGWELTSGSKPCQSCAEAKAKQKNMVKSSSGGKAKAPNECLFHDLAIVKAPKDSEHKVTQPVW